MPVLLVRHGETDWSVTRRHTGRRDVPLTDQGRRQAGLLAGALRSVSPVLALASPLSRARDTAALAGLDAEVEPDLAEWDYGRYEGLTTAEIRVEAPGWSVWTGDLPGGETLDEVAARADRVLARVRGPADGGTVVLVAHAHLLRVLAARWLGRPPGLGRHLALDTATVSMLGDDRGTPVIERWNDGHHLES